LSVDYFELKVDEKTKIQPQHSTSNTQVK